MPTENFLNGEEGARGGDWQCGTDTIRDRVVTAIAATALTETAAAGAEAATAIMAITIRETCS